MNLQSLSAEPRIQVVGQAEFSQRLPALAGVGGTARVCFAQLSSGLAPVLAQGFGHRPYCLEATAGDAVVGLLPLVLMRSLLFGRFLVGLPYLNVGGAMADDSRIAAALIDRAVVLADEFDVRYLELRHEQAIEHPVLGARLTTKVHMRLPLPATAEPLWDGFSAKVRNQVRKGEKANLTVIFGGGELLAEFYDVFAREHAGPRHAGLRPEVVSRDFCPIPQQAEFCVVRMEGKPIAAALLVHGPGLTEVGNAGSLRPYNSTNANMLMYWHLLKRAIERGNRVFDFGRSTIDSNTFRFKKQWGAEPHAATWQYYVRRGTISDMRRESGNLWTGGPGLAAAAGLAHTADRAGDRSRDTLIDFVQTCSLMIKNVFVRVDIGVLTRIHHSYHRNCDVRRTRSAAEWHRHSRINWTTNVLPFG